MLVKASVWRAPEYQYKLGVTYYALRHIPEAIAVFENLAREHPDLDLVQFFLGNVYQTTGAFDKAERSLQKGH